MAAREKVEFVISARDRSRAALRRIRRGFAAVGRMAARVGLAAAAGLVATGLAAARLARELDNTSKQLGVNIENLDRLRQVAAATGIPFQTMIGAFEELRQRQGEAISGNEELRKTFKQFGVSIDNLKGENLTQLLLRIADVAKRVNEEGNLPQLTAAIDRLGGSEFARLLPLLVQGPEALASALRSATPVKRRNVDDVLRADSAARGKGAAAQSLAVNATGDAVVAAEKTAGAVTEQTRALSRKFDVLIEQNRKTEDQTFGVFGA